LPPQFSEPLAPGMCQREGFIFISSPGAVTPFHLDPEHNFLLQIKMDARSIEDGLDHIDETGQHRQFLGKTEPPWMSIEREELKNLIEQVLVTDAKYYVKHFGARMYKPVLGNGLVTSEGDFWLRQRRLVQPAFVKSRIAIEVQRAWHFGPD
jgi:cytochrome P450